MFISENEIILDKKIRPQHYLVVKHSHCYLLPYTVHTKKRLHAKRNAMLDRKLL